MDFSISKTQVLIKNIGTRNYNRLDDSFDLILSLDANGNNDSVMKKFKYGEKPEDITSIIMKSIKEKFTNSSHDSYSISHNAVVIERFDEIEEKIIAFLKKVNDKIKDFKYYKKMSYFDMTNTINNLNSKL